MKVQGLEAGGAAHIRRPIHLMCDVQTFSINVDQPGPHAHRRSGHKLLLVKRMRFDREQPLFGSLRKVLIQVPLSQ